MFAPVAKGAKLVDLGCVNQFSDHIQCALCSGSIGRADNWAGLLLGSVEVIPQHTAERAYYTAFNRTTRVVLGYYGSPEATLG